MVEAVYGAHTSTFAEASPIPQSSQPAKTVGQDSPAEGSADAVTLSTGAQAHQLLHQGQSVAQIASALGTSVSTVDSYLGITPASAAGTPAVSSTTLKAAASLATSKAG